MNGKTRMDDRGWRMAKSGDAGCGLTRLSERRSPDPARGCRSDSRRVGDRRTNRIAVRYGLASGDHAAGCDLLDTLVTGKKFSRPGNSFLGYSHVYSPILTYSHIKNIFSNGANSVPNSPWLCLTHLQLTSNSDNSDPTHLNGP
jgi:hypothetical protein